MAFLFFGGGTILAILVESRLGNSHVKFDWNWLRHVAGDII